MNDDLLEALIAAGTPAALVAQVARLIGDAEVLRRRREQDAANHREARARLKTSADVSDVSDAGGIYKNNLFLSSSSESQSKKRKKVSIPENWLPNEKGIALAKQEGFDEPKIKLEIHRFKDYAQQHNRQYADWQAAWRNWVTSPFQQKANGNGNGSRQLQDDRLSVSKAAERLAERNVEFPPRPSLVSGTSTPHRRLLPER